MWPVVAVIACAYACMSAVTLVMFCLDKRAAQRGKRRVSERTLHTLELLGGWPGALVGQRWLRHKSAKASYRAVLWLIVGLHVAGWAAAAWMCAAR